MAMKPLWDEEEEESGWTSWTPASTTTTRGHQQLPRNVSPSASADRFSDLGTRQFYSFATTYS